MTLASLGIFHQYKHLDYDKKRFAHLNSRYFEIFGHLDISEEEECK